VNTAFLNVISFIPTRIVAPGTAWELFSKSCTILSMGTATTKDRSKLFPKYSVYWWGYIHKLQASEYQKCPLLGCREPAMASTSWESTPMERKRMVWFDWKPYYWSLLYWNVSICWNIRCVFVKHPTPSLRRHTIEKSNADVVPIWWLYST
jgi:hypothetical protein